MSKKKILLSLTLAASFLAIPLTITVNAEEITGQNNVELTSPPEGYYEEVLAGQRNTANYIKENKLSKKDLTLTKKSEDIGVLAIPIPDGSLGNKGDILYTASGSSSVELPVGGHAAIAVDQYSTIEAMGTRGSKDGVRYWTNNFKERYSDARGYRVTNATATQKQNAVNYAIAQLYDPYNYNFYNKNIDTAFYCSQLVWKSWNQQGFDLDFDGGSAVWPIDLVMGSKVRGI